MSDEQSTTSATSPTPAAGNDQAARTPTGEIKDQQATQATATHTTGTQTSEPAKPEPKPEGEGKAAEPGKVPDKYDFKAPEGFEIDTKFVEQVTPVLKDLGLTQDQANKLFDIYAKHSAESADAPYREYETLRQGWRDEITKDRALGDGQGNLSVEAKKNIDTAISAIGDAKAIDAFKAAMDLTGAGDNPAFVRAMNAIGKALGEGTNVRGSGPSPAGQRNPASAPRSAAQALFPNLPSSAQS